MGLFLKKNLPNANIGVWEISESVQELYQRLDLTPAEIQTFGALRSESRKLHWLSYRMILPHLIDWHTVSGISYDEYGKPYLDNGVRHISVTHSGKYAALIASPTHSVGIDIEHVSEKILNITHKFLTTQELELLGSKADPRVLYLYWAGKEAIYKLHGRRNILFKDNIFIHPFEFQPKEGTFEGKIISPGMQKHFKLSYLFLDDYVLVYLMD